MNTRVILTEEMPAPDGVIPAGTFGDIVLDIDPMVFGGEQINGVTLAEQVLWPVKFDDGHSQYVNGMFLDTVGA